MCSVRPFLQKRGHSVYQRQKVLPNIRRFTDNNVFIAIGNYRSVTTPVINQCELCYQVLCSLALLVSKRLPRRSVFVGAEYRRYSYGSQADRPKNFLQRRCRFYNFFSSFMHFMVYFQSEITSGHRVNVLK